MPPKQRRDREAESSRTNRIDHVQSDHELFLQAFEKPTQIYRYLRTRNMISPIFLQRTLTYMKQRMLRNNNLRSEFKVDNMLCQKMNKSKTEKINGTLGDYMTLLFIGFYDKNIIDKTQCEQSVKVETILLKISHKKRKDSSSAFMQIPFGISDVEINPIDNNNIKVPAVSITTESFKPVGGPLNRSYSLLLRVQTYPTTTTTTTTTTTPTTNNTTETINNGLITANNLSSDEPATKRLKNNNNNTKLYGAELVVFDKHGRWLLTEGEYVLVLQEILYNSKTTSPKKHLNWETIQGPIIDDYDKIYNPFEEFEKSPTLKFRLIWTKEQCQGMMEQPLPIEIKKIEQTPIPTQTTTTTTTSTTNLSNKENQPDFTLINYNNNINNNNININNDGITNNIRNNNLINNKSDMLIDDKLQIVYQFIYNNNSRQQTEACADYHCPWCSLNCKDLYPLLKHLKLCHARFTFTYVPTINGARVDVAINELYDGSYTGSPHDLVGQSGFAFLRTGPVRRTSVTNLLVCRPRRLKPLLSEFLEIDETEINNQRPYITGHNRLYHHTETCLPVHPKELDIDSEGESDPQWLQYKTLMMIDEFTDVNEGEKELMKMWNLHIMKYGYVGDCQIPIACEMFLDKQGPELLKKNLYRNFILHMSSLFDYGIISPDVLYRTVQKLQKILSEYPEAKKVMTDARSEQVDYWNKYGIIKHQLQQQQGLLDDDDEQQQQSKKQQTQIIKQKNTKDIKKELINNKEQKLVNSSTATTTTTGNLMIKGVNVDQILTRKTSITQFQSKTASETNGPMKRRLMQLKESPQRRRSAASLLTERTDIQPTRRKSIAIPTTVNSRKRLPLSLTKVDKKIC